MAIIDIIRLAKAAESFHIHDDFEFLDFEDLTDEGIKAGNAPDVLDIWAQVKIKFDGEAPESYKILNLAIGDWVESHLGALTDVIHRELKDHLKSKHSEVDLSDLDDPDNTAIWTDQLDYMPDIEEREKSILIDIELVLHGESVDE